MDPISEGIDAEIVEAKIQDDLEIGDNAEVFNNDQAAVVGTAGAPPALPGGLRQGFSTQYQTGPAQRQYAPPYGVYQNPMASQFPRGESPSPPTGLPTRTRLQPPYFPRGAQAEQVEVFPRRGFGSRSSVDDLSDRHGPPEPKFTLQAHRFDKPEKVSDFPAWERRIKSAMQSA